MANRKVYANKNTEITLTDKNFLSSGGEGELYKKSNTIYKIFFKPDPHYEQKIFELQVLDSNPSIVVPKTILTSKDGKFIGYTMDFVKDATSLSQLFTSSFRNRNGITPESTIDLVNNMIKVVQFIHDHDILMVDGNELNYMVDQKGFVNPYFIDVDSYQTKNFPAPVLMPSIQDYHSKTFSKLTDWFSFSIVAFQLFVGIHPYKGTHPNYKPNQLADRMKANISVFNKDVRVPASIRSFDLIPNDVRNYFFDTFEKGKRSLPPMITGKILVKAQQTFTLAKFDINLMYTFPEKIVRVANGIFYGKDKAYGKRLETYNYSGVLFPFENQLYDFSTDGEMLTIRNANKDIIINENYIAAKRVGILNGTPFGISEDKLFKLKLLDVGTKVITSVQTSWPILSSATVPYGGLLFSNMLGKYFLYVPTESGGMDIFHVPEMEGYKILDMKHEKNVIQAILYKDGSYHRIVLWPKKDKIEEYLVKWYHDIIMTETNFTVLDNGVYLTLTASNELIVSSMRSDQDKVLTDCNLPTDTILFSEGNDVYYTHGQKVLSLKMR